MNWLFAGLVERSRWNVRLCAALAGATTVSDSSRLFSSSTTENNNNCNRISIKGTPEYDSISHNNAEDKFLFMTTISAPLIDTQNRSAIDLVCVLDESGSMNGEPIDLLKESMKFIVSNLTSNDRFGCIGYDSNIRTISSINYMTSAIKQDTLKRINSMQAGTATALCEGLESGVNMMRDCKINDLKKDIDSKSRVKNILLLTDGQANVGYTDPRDIIHALNDKSFADQMRSSSVSRKPSSKLKKFMNATAEWIQLTPENVEQDVEKIYGDIPCSIDTFGFGQHHDANFLTMLSEYGRGLYTFVSTTDDIAGTFGEMLGGMLSVVGKDIKVRIKTLNDNVKISKCLAIDDNSGLKLKEIEKNQYYEIQILNDIQSEESKDLLFELSIPKIDAINNEWNYLYIECEYFNIFTNETEKMSTICQIQRSEDSMNISKIRNYEIDIQYNRIISTTSVKSAMEAADKGDFETAKKIIKDAQQLIANSVSKDDDYCQSLITDLDGCIGGMESREMYDSIGSKRNQSFHQTNVWQRGYQGFSPDADMGSFKLFRSKTKGIWRKQAETQTKKQPK